MLHLLVQPFILDFRYSNSRINSLAVSRRKLTTAVATVVVFITSLYTITMVVALQPLQPKIMKRRLVWHRNKDLRFHDHPFYEQETNEKTTTETTSVFVFDDAFGCGIQPSTCLPNEWKAVHLGPHGMRVLLESVQDLRANSRRIFSQDLFVRRGPTVPTLLGLLEELIQLDIETKNKNNNSSTNIEEHGEDETVEYLYEVCWNEEPGWHERKLSETFKAALTKRFETLASNCYCEHDHRIRLSINTAMSCTVYHPDDLPSPGEWQPLSKKEKRRRQKQEQRKSQGVKRKGDTSSAQTAATFTKNSNLKNCVDASLDRWDRMPRIMGDFRKIAREKAGIRQCNNHRQDIPRQKEEPPLPLKLTQSIDPGFIPSLEELLEPMLAYIGDGEENDLEKQPILGLPASVIQAVCQNSLRIHHQNLLLMEKQSRDENEKEVVNVGGETAGLKHLDNFVTNHAHTAQRSLACVENNQSSRLSHYLAFGCLSPRKVVAAAEASIAARRKQEKETNSGTNENDGTWLISHMTMRDFFLYTCLASGKQFYQLEGIPVSQKVASSIKWRSFEGGTAESEASHELWRSWATGTTGLPLVDAAMAELLEKGYCSNRVRQNAASVLTKDLKLDWRAGAEWFQFLLEDHCVGANWGNWLYFSGVGPDPKNRHFCTVSQALKYDPNGEYVTQWVPSLRTIPSRSGDKQCQEAQEEYFLRPWDFDPSWKGPLVDPETQYTWRDLERLKETGRLLEGSSTGN